MRPVRSLQRQRARGARGTRRRPPACRCAARRAPRCPARRVAPRLISPCCRRAPVAFLPRGRPEPCGRPQARSLPPVNAAFDQGVVARRRTAPFPICRAAAGWRARGGRPAAGWAAPGDEMWVGHAPMGGLGFPGVLLGGGARAAQFVVAVLVGRAGRARAQGAHREHRARAAPRMREKGHRASACARRAARLSLNGSLRGWFAVGSGGAPAGAARVLASRGWASRGISGRHLGQRSGGGGRGALGVGVRQGPGSLVSG
jgi:hypothetical protein